jgi:hypothetical protein
MLKVSYHVVKGVELQCSLGSIQYAVSIIGLVTNTSQCRSCGFGGPGRSKNSHLDYCLVIAFYYLNHGLLIIVFNLYQK